MALEPDVGSDKVDIIWHYARGSKVVQVKSSQNQIDVPSARAWASDLEECVLADEYELQLIGPCSIGVSNMGQHGKVRIPAPQPLNLDSLIAQAAHKLDLYLQSCGLSRLTPLVRELLVHGLANKLAQYSTCGAPVTRQLFDTLLRGWIAEMQGNTHRPYPLAPSAQALHQLPPPPVDFVGREDEISRIEGAVRAGRATTVGVRGMGGIGKSALALVVAERLLSVFPDAQLYLDLGGNTSTPLSAADVMAYVIRAFAPDAELPAQPDELSGFYRSLLHGRRVLLLVENASSQEQLLPLVLPGGSLVLYTSRNKFAVPGQLAEDLPSLPPEHAKSLLIRIAPRTADIAETLVDLCGYLPLAVRLAAGTLANRPDLSIPNYIERLIQGKARLELIEASIELSYDLLDLTTKARFLILVLFVADFDAAAAASIWDTSPEDADRTLGTLITRSLLEWNSMTQRYRIHDLIHVFINDRASQEDLHNAKLRFARHYAGVCEKAHVAYKKGHEELDSALGMFDRERPNITIAFLWIASRSQIDEEAAHLCSDFLFDTVFFRDLRQHPLERIQWLVAGDRQHST